MSTIVTREEGKRGCGYRKGGGLYLVSDDIGKPCGKLPLSVPVCPACGAGIKPSRGWTWINPQLLFEDVKCSLFTGPGLTDKNCAGCLISDYLMPNCAGLLWIGEKYYKTPGEWVREGGKMGFSRKVRAIPRDIIIGDTLIFAAHRKAIVRVTDEGEEKYTPAIFYVWRPQRIEYVVKGDESAEKLESMEKRGITLIKIVRKGDQESMDLLTVK